MDLLAGAETAAALKIRKIRKWPIYALSESTLPCELLYSTESCVYSILSVCQSQSVAGRADGECLSLSVCIFCVCDVHFSAETYRAALGTHARLNLSPRPQCVASRELGILFWQVMVPVYRCFRHQVRKLQGRQKDAKFKSGPQTKFQNRRCCVNF